MAVELANVGVYGTLWLLQIVLCGRGCSATASAATCCFGSVPAATWSSVPVQRKLRAVLPAASSRASIRSATTFTTAPAASTRPRTTMAPADWAALR